MMKYSIGEFASILGVTTDTLRLYEKHGIIRPMKDDKNNYRYFDDLDVRDLYMSRWYRSMQFSLPEVAELNKQSSIAQVSEKVDRTRANLEEEIRKSTMLLQKMTEVHQIFQTIESTLNCCQVKQLPGIYRIRQTDKNILLMNDFLRATIQQWMNLLPFSFFSFRIEQQEILSEEQVFNYNWGLAINETEARYFDLHLNSDVEYIESRLCVSSVIISSGDEYMIRQSLQFMFDYLEANNHLISGDIIGRIIFTEKLEDEKRTYLEVNIPI